jgi:hypothetical protein
MDLLTVTPDILFELVSIKSLNHSSSIIIMEQIIPRTVLEVYKGT